MSEQDKCGGFDSGKSSRFVSLNPFSNLASNFRRASSHLNLTDLGSPSKKTGNSECCESGMDCGESSEASTSSPKKRSKWIKKFNCVKLKCIKNSIASSITADCSKNDGEKDNKNCGCSNYLEKNEETKVEDNLEGAVARLNTTEVENEDASGADIRTRPIGQSESLYGIVNALQDESDNGESSSSASIHPSDNTDVEEVVDEFVRHSSTHSMQEGCIMITQHICGRSSNNLGEKKCFQFICPTEINVDTLRNLSILVDTLRLQSVDDVKRCHTQVDYIHYLVPDLRQITSCSFYWGKMDRYEAERLLEGKPEGTFLLRDSAQEEFLFSVSFRKYGRSLHARIEQFNHKFSFDSHDPGVFASDTVCGLIEHYKDPLCCMFFEPVLTLPLHRNFTFSLQHLTRSIIASRLTYDTVDLLQLPNLFKMYLKEYHYRQKVCVKRFDLGELQCVDM